MDNIDVVFYINLSSREDRKEHFLKEISKLCSDSPKIQRIDAVPNKDGALGCVMSHCKTLELFIENPTWHTCMIFEDDFTFHNSEKSYNNDAIDNVFKKFPEWDCCMLSVGVTDLKLQDTVCENVKKVILAQTASGYCITKKFAHVLLENFKESRNLMMKFGRRHDICVDQYWKRIQPINNWYVIKPVLGYQYENYSNIEGKTTNYGC